MKRKTSTWDDLNELLGINKRNINYNVFYLVVVVAVIFLWFFLSELSINYYLKGNISARSYNMYVDIVFIVIIMSLTYLILKQLIYSNQRLREINSFLASVADSSNEIVIYAINRQYRYIYFNKMHQDVVTTLWGKAIENQSVIFDHINFMSDKVRLKSNLDLALNGKNFQTIEEYGDPNITRQHWQNYYAPIYNKDHIIIGASCFSINISALVEAEKQSRLLSNTDPLTGLYNRRYFNEAKHNLDTSENLPLSIIIADVNGLKFTNDIFGHFEGDQLIKQFTNILRHVLQKDAVITRLGGDEFAIILPKTSRQESQAIIIDLESHIANTVNEKLKLSVTFGCATKYETDTAIDDVITQADNLMYHNKLTDRLSFENEMITSLSNYFYENPIELDHAQQTSQYAVLIGQALGLNEDDINILRLAGYLHDIGKITLDHQMLTRNSRDSIQRKESIMKHCEAGYKILNFFDRYREVAPYVLSHHEHIDGSGLPNGLVGDEIPLLSKIIAVANIYAGLTAKNVYYEYLSKQEAILELNRLKKSHLDANIVNIFIDKVLN